MKRYQFLSIISILAGSAFLNARDLGIYFAGVDLDEAGLTLVFAGFLAGTVTTLIDRILKGKEEN